MHAQRFGRPLPPRAVDESPSLRRFPLPSISSIIKNRNIPLYRGAALHVISGRQRRLDISESRFLDETTFSACIRLRRLGTVFHLGPARRRCARGRNRHVKPRQLHSGFYQRHSCAVSVHLFGSPRDAADQSTGSATCTGSHRRRWRANTDDGYGEASRRNLDARYPSWSARSFVPADC